jgi:hypothetical protein
MFTISKFFLSAVLLMSSCAYANTSPATTPAVASKKNVAVHCKKNRQIAVRKQRFYLNVLDAKPKVYFIHNTSKQTFWLNHETGQSMSAGWSSQIAPGQWSAILLNTRNFNLTCTQIGSAGVACLNCADLISVCQATNVNTAKTTGEYWIAENQTYPHLIAQLAKYRK